MKYSVLIAAVLCQIAVQIGSDCSFGSGDEFACSINFFLTCVKDKWILQNTCTTACKDDSTLNWQCFRNRVNSARITTTASATTTTQDITRTQTPLASASLDSKASTASDQTYGAQPATFTIVLICIGTIIAVGLFIFFFFSNI